ncbi:hypothetical protein GLOIN_2v1871772 [Rhizophagus clarus]|uniref:Uncharacterized protein n=1 Tax=Rhizophagus clarus TaxID=94130 RepID=A0A8H3M3R4_9GLOM|nr:hypothetical protein GLOIN_2v1871772 [Rhizophagus clarus]
MATNSPITTTSKGKGKKKKHKHITISEEDIDKDFRLPVDSVDKSTQALSSQPPLPPSHDANKKVEESSAPLLDNNAGKEKRLKVQDAEAAQVITGYQAPPGCQFIRDILIYDISAKWDNYELLSHLSTWGNNYEAQWMAPLAGIPTRWFPATWNLAERKERERFQAIIYDLPEVINTALLTAPQHLTFLSELNIKMFKEIKFPDGSRKIVRYFETWEHLQKCISNPTLWYDKNVSWCKHITILKKPKKISPNSSHSAKRKNQEDRVDTKSSTKLSKSTPATGSNKTHIRNPQMKDSKVHQRKDDNDSQALKKPSKRHHGAKSKISKRDLYAEVRTIKKILDELTSNLKLK